MVSLHSIVLALLNALPDDPARFAGTIGTVAAQENAGTWSDLVSYASYHGVLGVINSQLTQMTELPAQVRDTALRRLALEELWHAHLVEGLDAAVSILTDAGIGVGALKGPVLAARLYSPPAARYCVDVDLLVRPTDLQRALEVFTRAGYVTETGVSAAYLLKYSHHLRVSRPGAALIELHFRAYAGFGVELPADDVMARTRLFRLREGLSVLVLSPEDEFVYLAAHAAGHSFIRLMWLYDLKLLVRRNPALDWDQVAERAEAFGVATVVAYTIRLLDRWMGVAIADLPGRLTRHGVGSRIADRLLTEVSTPRRQSARDQLGGLLFTSMLCDTARSGAWLWRHHLGRMTRRRLHRLAPVYLPERWSA